MRIEITGHFVGGNHLFEIDMPRELLVWLESGGDYQG
jgi:hypothetical protein